MKTQRETKLSRHLMRIALALAFFALASTLTAPTGAAGPYDGAANPYEEYYVRIQVTSETIHDIDDACGGPEFYTYAALRDHDPGIAGSTWPSRPFDVINNRTVGPYGRSGEGVWLESSYRSPVVFGRFDLWEDDDAICGGGDDHIDISPVAGYDLRVEVFPLSRLVMLRASDGTVTTLGSVPASGPYIATPISFRPTNKGEERRYVTSTKYGKQCWSFRTNTSYQDVELCVILAKI